MYPSCILCAEQCGLTYTAVLPQGQNELWLAIALSHPAVSDLNGPQLAAFLGALLSAEVIKRPISIWAAYSTSPKVRITRRGRELDAVHSSGQVLVLGANQYNWLVHTALCTLSAP